MMLKQWAAAAVLAVATGVSHAALVSLGDGSVRDDRTGLIWLQNWNLNGARSWDDQNAWATGLTLAGSSDWRLPSADEFEDLFGAYGNLSVVPQFTAVGFRYWTATPSGSNGALAFSARSGGTVSDPRTERYDAVAVRFGDVTSPVSEPQTLALALLALAATAMARRRRSR